MIVAAFTVGTRYEVLAQSCRRAWENVGQDVELLPYEDLGSWQRNMLAFGGQAFGHWKTGPLFVIGVDTLPGPAYCRELERLTEILKTHDVLCEYRPGRQRNMLIHSGIVGYADSPWGKRIYTTHAMNLAVELRKDSDLNDQEILHDWLVLAESQGARWHRLPCGYNSKTRSPDAKLIHGHASRGK